MNALRLTLLFAVFAGQVSASSLHGAPAPSLPATATPLNRDQFLADLARDLSAHFNLEGELQLELPRGWAAPATTAAQWTLDVAEYPTLASSAMLVRCRILGDGVLAADTTFVLRATHTREVWVVRQPVAPGVTFDPAALDTRRVDLFRERESLPTSAGDRNFVFTRAVSAGRILTWHDLARRPLVRKGDLVEASVSDGRLVVTMKALALENGAQGDTVTVRNPESRKDFVAVVTHENHVQVRF
ncbi:MAG: flagellar basal body P-ring formation protein FlgA [Undibacterium sp.]|nr:flagellar basal body P-ring formation protein FlgA [Opitutaceae bacterium]